MTAKVLHPAKFSPEVLEALWRLVEAERRRVVGRVHDAPLTVLDPFAGVGRIHQLAQPGKVRTIAVEIEHEWAELAPYRETPHGYGQGTLHGDLFHWLPRLARNGDVADVIATSPTYGNRFADHHKAQDGSRRRSYTHDLGRELHSNNSGRMHWGARYWVFHAEAYRLMLEAVRPGGLLLLNVSDFQKAHRLVPAATMHHGLAIGAGWQPIAMRTVNTQRLRGVGVTTDQATEDGPAPTDGRAPHEVIYSLRRPEAD